MLPLFRSLAVFCLLLCLPQAAQAIVFPGDTAETEDIPYLEDNGSPPEDMAFPVVYYLVDNGMGTALRIRYGHTTASNPFQERIVFGYRGTGTRLPRYIGYITVHHEPYPYPESRRPSSPDYRITFTDKGSGGTDIQTFLEGYDRELANCYIANAERTAKVERRGWNAVVFIMDALKKNNTLAAIYRTTGIPPDPNFRPEFAKTTGVLLDELLSVTFTPPYGKFDARITNPLPGMTLEYLAEPEAK